MNSETPPRRSNAPVVILCALLFGAIGLAAGYLIGHRSDVGQSHEEKSAEDKPLTSDGEEETIATVRTAPVRRGSIVKTIHAYGPVVARAGASHVV
jgi:hypothetical protein